MFVCGYTVLFFFNDTATTEIYTLSLHDALPISFGMLLLVRRPGRRRLRLGPLRLCLGLLRLRPFLLRELPERRVRSEEHTSELQSRQYLVCRLLLEKKTSWIFVCSGIIVLLAQI